MSYSSKTKYNERSWGIDLISAINSFVKNKDIIIKNAGGEYGLKSGNTTLFPDVLLYGDNMSGKIIQGWELKMPDTDIDDSDFIKNAKEKAISLNLNSFLLWNVTYAKLYSIDSNGNLCVIKIWDELSFITNRDDVLRNKEKWIKQLEHILLDLNNYLYEGTIKSSNVIDTLCGNSILNLVFKNKQVLADKFKEEIKSNIVFNDHINLWWDSIAQEYPKGTNKYEVLAQINLLSWTIKFVFGNLIKCCYNAAKNIEDIKSNINPIDAIKICEDISSKSDFWNIFKKQLGDEFVPPQVWEDLTEFNNFLVTSNIQNIEKELWQSLFENIISMQNRKMYGQYSTPKKLADILTNLTINNKLGNVLDPCCGTGTILKSVIELKEKFNIDRQDIIKSVWGSDKISFPLQLANITLLNKDLSGEVLQLFQEDVINLIIDKCVSFSDPNTGEEVIRVIPKFDNIVSNLPFVQFETIRQTNSPIKKINEFISNYTYNQKLDNKSDLSFYIVFYLWRLLSDNGRLGVIISNSWLGTKSGNKFLNLLRQFFNLEYIVTSGNGRWFKNTKVVTNLLILNKRSFIDLNIEDSKQITNFVILHKKIEDINIDIDLATIRVQKDVRNSSVTKIAYTNSEIKELEKLNIQWASLFADIKWLNEISDKITKANQFFEIKRGERKGWDKLFYPKDISLFDNVFIKPVLKNTRFVNTLIANTDGNAFCCTVNMKTLSEKYKKTYLQIKNFECKYNSNNTKLLPVALKNNKPYWYSMETSTMADLITTLNPEDRLFVAKFKEPSFVNQRLIRFTKINNNVDLDICHALLNSLLGMFFLESLGFGRGEGALDLNATKLSQNLYMLNPLLLKQEQKTNIMSKFNQLKVRKIEKITDELNYQDRIEFDNEVLKAFGIINYKDKIKKSLLSLYNIRKSVKN